MTKQTIRKDTESPGWQYDLFSLLGLELSLPTSKTKTKKPEHEYHDNRVALSIKETSYMLNVGINSVYNLINRGILPSFKIGARRLVSVEAVNNFIAKSEQEENYYA